MSAPKASDASKKPRKLKTNPDQEIVKSCSGKQKVGRPSIFNQDLADEICNRIAQGESLRSIGRDDIMPPAGTVLRWVSEKKEFRDQYEVAMEQRAEGLFEEILEIADETDNDTVETETGDRPNTEWISRSRLRVDARKWILSKMVPKKYGDRMQHANDPDNPLIGSLSDEDLGRRIAQLEHKIKGSKP